MTEESRYLCSELVNVLYEDAALAISNTTANLEEISAHGAELLAEQPIEPGTAVSFSVKGQDLFGVIQSSAHDPVLGWLLRVKLEAESHWSGRRFVPQHFLPLRATPISVPETYVPARSR